MTTVLTRWLVSVSITAALAVALGETTGPSITDGCTSFDKFTDATTYLDPFQRDYLNKDIISNWTKLSDSKTDRYASLYLQNLQVLDVDAPSMRFKVGEMQSLSSCKCNVQGLHDTNISSTNLTLSPWPKIA